MRFWLFMCFLIIGIIPLAVYERMILNTYEERIVNLRVEQLQGQCTILGNQLSVAGYMEGSRVYYMDSAVEQLASQYNGRIFIVDSGLRIIKDTYSLRESKILLSERVVWGMRGEATSVYSAKDLFIEISVPIKNTQTNQVTGVMVASIPTDDLEREFDILQKKSQVLFVVSLLLISTVAIIAATLLVKPLKQLTDSFGRVARGHMGTAIPTVGFTETRKISYSFNRLLGQLRKQDESRQEFVSNVSHELKTPITSVKVLTDSLLSQEAAPVELYREFLTDISAEIDRESKIISDLLSMVKLEQDAADMNVDKVNINEMTEGILKRLRPLAQQRNIELTLENIRLVLADADEVKLSLAVTNLVENAIKYNRDNGWVKVTINSDHTNFYIKVGDSGIGIGEDEQKRIFERFYRVDKARSRSTGGTGLGLSITREIVLMHAGMVSVSSVPDEGSVFTVTIPLTFASGEGKRLLN